MAKDVYTRGYSKTEAQPARRNSCREAQEKLINSVHAEVGSRTIEELEAERDEVLLGLIELRTRVQSNRADESNNKLVSRDRKAQAG